MHQNFKITFLAKDQHGKSLFLPHDKFLDVEILISNNPLEITTSDKKQPFKESKNTDSTTQQLIENSQWRFLKTLQQANKLALFFNFCYFRTNPLNRFI